MVDIPADSIDRYSVDIDALRKFALIVSAQVFCASHVGVARASSPGPREEKCHAKVCKQIWRPRRKVKQEGRSGRFIKGGELNRRKSSAEKVRVVPFLVSQEENFLPS